MQEMQVRALGPLEKEMGTHYSIPAWKIHEQGLQSTGPKGVTHN